MTLKHYFFFLVNVQFKTCLKKFPLFTDLLGCMCTCSYGEYSHLCHHPRIFLGLWQQWRLQLAAVVKGRRENYHRHLVMQWPSIQMREWAIKRSSVASLLSILDAPFHLVCSECTTVADRVPTFFMKWRDDWFHFYLWYVF